MINENHNCYASLKQREILLSLLEYSDIESKFFLTGGTALSVFYLHHRISEDLDLFTANPIKLSELDIYIKREWGEKSNKLKDSQHFLSYLIDEIKVDFVIDHLSLKEKRIRFRFENGKSLFIDSINNIASNKFNTIVSRTEPKDFIDFYFICKKYNTPTLDEIFNAAKIKDAIFDDPPTVAFQIEDGIKFLKENDIIMPEIKIDFSIDDLYDFYKKITLWLYNKVKIY